MCVTACSNVTKVVRTTRVGMSRQIHTWQKGRYGSLYPDFNDNTITLINHNGSFSVNSYCNTISIRRCAIGVNISCKARRTNSAGTTAVWIRIPIPGYSLNTVIEATVTDKVVEYDVTTHYLPVNLGGRSRDMINYILKYNKSSIIIRYIVSPPNSSSTYHIVWSRSLPLLDAVNIQISKSYSAESKYFEFKVNGHKCFGELMGIY